LSALGEEERDLLALLSGLCELLSEIPYEQLLEVERKVGVDNSNISNEMDQALRAGGFVTYCAEYGLIDQLLAVMEELGVKYQYEVSCTP